MVDLIRLGALALGCFSMVGLVRMVIRGLVPSSSSPMVEDRRAGGRFAGPSSAMVDLRRAGGPFSVMVDRRLAGGPFALSVMVDLRRAGGPLPFSPTVDLRRTGGGLLGSCSSPAVDDRRMGGLLS